MLSFQEKGRLSQSETEEEEEIPVKKKVKDKKKGSSLKEEGKKKKKQKNEPQTTPSHPYPNLPVPQEVLDMPVDPNEPTYCLCGQVSYGEMIGCDNPDCPIEWFHVSREYLLVLITVYWHCQPISVPLHVAHLQTEGEVVLSKVCSFLQEEAIVNTHNLCLLRLLSVNCSDFKIDFSFVVFIVKLNK